METFNCVRRFFVRYIQNVYFKKNVIAGFILGLTVIIKNSIHYTQFVGSHTVNVVEPYIINFSNKGDAMIMILGCLIVMADAPFIDTDSFYLVHRVKRKQWYVGMWLYMTTMCIAYYLILFLTSSIVIINKGYIENTWSQTMLRILKGQTDIMRDFGLDQPIRTIMSLTPYETLFHTIMWIMLYSLCLCAILFVFNMKLNKNAFGTIVTGVVHIVSMLMCFQWIGGVDLTKWSLFRNAIFPVYYAPKDVSLIFSYCYVLLIIYVIYIVGELLLPYTSFMLNTERTNE